MVGTDMVYVPRIERILESRFGMLFLRNVYTEAERRSFAACHHAHKAASVASVFALKEATIKASMGKLTISDLHCIEIVTQQGTNPRIEVNAVKLEGRFLGSVSKAGDYVIAVAAWSGGPGAVPGA